ncbi:hypothetical protein EON65_51940 [archaeon]|nr:MAG: hypothetical protein EON65_51940 [archaeon]
MMENSDEPNLKKSRQDDSGERGTAKESEKSRSYGRSRSRSRSPHKKHHKKHKVGFINSLFKAFICSNTT